MRAQHSLLCVLPTCAPKPWPCLRTTWKYFQNTCLGLPSRDANSVDPDRDLYGVKVPPILPKYYSRIIHVLFVPWVLDTFLTSKSLVLLALSLGSPLLFLDPWKYFSSLKAQFKCHLLQEVSLILPTRWNQWVISLFFNYILLSLIRTESFFPTTF